ncbi:MAG: ATP synthase F0 subunit B [Deltaproteobacteria bacterium]|nr:ATP synthase F0 subunit B [Deltaproteobacteria bacterium]
MNSLIPQLILMAAAGAEHGAAAHGEEHISWWVIGSMFTNFILFFGFLFVKLRRPVVDALAERRTNMAKKLEEAQAKQREAEAQLAEYKAKLANLEAEVAQVVASYEATAKAEVERMRQDNDKAIERLSRESDFTIQQEMRKAEKLIREAAVRATLEAAESLIKERITDADRRRLVDQYISNLEQSTPSA